MAIGEDELAKHKSNDSLWISVENKVYDLTEFQKRHPGGAKILKKVAGKDATAQFLKFHPVDVIDKMLKDKEKLGPLQKGKVDAEAKASENVKEDVKQAQEPEAEPVKQVKEPEAQPVKQVKEPDHPPTPIKTDTKEQTSVQPESKAVTLKASDLGEAELERNKQTMPDLGEILNLFDFEMVASRIMPRTAWYYYSAGSDDEVTLRENNRAFGRIWFRPRVLVNVTDIDFSAKFFGTKVAAPFYVSATALASLGHPDGETVLTKAAAAAGIPQMLSTLASCSIDEVAEASDGKQVLWMQVYVNAEREETKRFVEHAESLGVTGFFVTVDAPQLGRREKDMRSKYDAELADVQNDDEEADRSQGASRAISSFIDPSLSWKDMRWLRSLTTKPLALKGIQRWEDAVRAAECGVDAIVLSNHGGRQLEYARSAVEVLAEVMPALRERKLDRDVEVYIDGGIRRGTDVLKALCLGAKGVGIGRPFIYAMSTYGVRGVARAMQLLKDEIVMGMSLLGATSLDQLTPDLLDARSVGLHDAAPHNFTQESVYERLVQPEFKSKL